MKRRAFVSTMPAALAAQSTASPGPLKPKALPPGATVGLITPSTYVADPNQLLTMQLTAQMFGWKTKIGKQVGHRESRVGEDIPARIADLHAMFADPEVDGILCIRGGYGTPQLLDGLDYDLIRRNPKILLGYSDITGLHLAIHQKTGLVTFHGPTGLSPFTEFSQHWFKRATDPKPMGLLTNPVERNAFRPAHPLRTIRGGKAQGRLIGGNLTLVSCLMGTPYEPDVRGKIFFLEDVGEEPYRIDRMLQQLALAGKFEQCAGVVIGECVDCGPKQFEPSSTFNYTLGEVLDRVFTKVKVPVFHGLLFGHTADQITLPLGVMASIDADRKELKIEEAAVA
ncbi:S66 peptidase family protein [Bryobacter aggregatus]|uniref:S66 peptidase family protein n=1 Tax=Bryobacter aggregatus TaxID=360054 RepID=UPI0004E1C9D3|nr:LD-carboxypeptidase [Bryobacter aggregatus]